MLFLVGDLPGEDVTADVRVDDGEDQTLELGRLQRLHLPLHRAAEVEAVAVGEGQHLGSPCLPSVAGSS
ncbi:hypothetical protein [Streptomyces netropsis]|uniref:Uncharacterized protein n=1 Tax=Streptomyces netropsis TaxID=55404 RepID=A0A7W7LIW9_STRNE|nr:hypothetical protein [Streptomyces netropsis]MBB4890894.1 hypothetical protein [Streptomyces netropsis]GGR53116.1 hypothetical protein GCM10010219_67630 [Streptomyces netropsis]